MNDINQILDTKEEYFNSLKQIQEQIIDNDDPDEVISFITKTNLLSNKEYFLHLLQNIKKCVFIRPNKINFLLTIINFLKDSILKDFPKFRWLGYHIPSEFLDELKKMGVYNPKIIQLRHTDLDKYKKIIETIKNDDITTFQDTLAQTNIDINTQMNFKNYKIDKTQNPTFLDISAFFGSLKIFKFLFMNNVNKSKMIANYAVAGGNYDIIHILEGENVSFNDISVISTAIKFLRNDIVEYLDPAPADAFKLSARHFNIECLLNNLRAITSENSINSKISIDSEFDHICFKIVKHGYSELLRIACILNPNCVSIESPTHQYMIHQAIQSNFDEIVTFLCEYQNTDLNIKNGAQETPLFVAVRCKNLKIIEKLCSIEKVELNTRNISGETVLHFAIANPQILNVLCHNPRIELNVKNNEGNTPLHLAAAKGETESVNILVGLEKIDVNAQNNANNSPLFLAIEKGSLDIVKILASHKSIDTKIKNKDGVLILIFF